MKKRNCIIKKLWAWGTPYIQSSGWLIMMCTIILSSLSVFDKARAFDSRLTNVETAVSKMNNIDDKLNLAIQLLQGKNNDDRNQKKNHW